VYAKVPPTASGAPPGGLPSAEASVLLTPKSESTGVTTGGLPPGPSASTAISTGSNP